MSSSTPGPVPLLRQFHSGLTNQRADRYGTDRLALTREVLAAVRAAIGPGLDPGSAAAAVTSWPRGPA